MKASVAILVLVLFISLDARSLDKNKLADWKLELPNVNGKLTVKKNGIEGKISLIENGGELNVDTNGKDFTGEALWSNKKIGVDATIISKDGKVDGVLDLKGSIPIKKSIVNLEGAVDVSKNGIRGYNAQVDVDLPQTPWITKANIGASIGIDENKLNYATGLKTRDVEAQLMRDGDGKFTYKGVLKNEKNSVKFDGDFKGHVKYVGNAKLGELNAKITGDENKKNIKYKINYDVPTIHAILNGNYLGYMDYDLLLDNSNTKIDLKGDSRGNIGFDANVNNGYANFDVKGQNKKIVSWEAHSGIGIEKGFNGFSLVEQDMVHHGVKNLGGSIDIGLNGDSDQSKKYLGSVWLGPVGAKIEYDKESKKPKIVGLLNVDENIKGSVDIDNSKIGKFDGLIDYKNLNILNTNVNVNANVKGDEEKIIGKGDIKFHNNDIKLNLETKKNYYHIAGSLGNLENAVDLSADTNGVYEVGVKINGQRYGFQM